jgi:hypothetical protein
MTLEPSTPKLTALRTMSQFSSLRVSRVLEGSWIIKSEERHSREIQVKPVRHVSV